MFTKPGLVIGLLILWTGGQESLAQIHASERAAVSQTVDGTTLTVDFARPRIRGRESVFGGEVKWGEVWTPGANMATTLEVSKNIQINGHPVPKGKYSVWMTVTKGDWTVLLDTVASLFHTDRPKQRDAGQIRFDLRPEHRPRIEVLTWWFPEVKSDGAVLAMQWDTVYVPLRIKVESSYSLSVSPDVGRRIVGSYEMKWVSGPPDGSASPADSAPQVDSTGGDASGSMKIDITYDKGTLWAHVDPPPFPGYNLMALLQVKDDWFIGGWWMNGELYDVSDEMVMEFKVEGGRASGFDLRMKNDKLAATAKRTR
jgi:hypothetical protein